MVRFDVDFTNTTPSNFSQLFMSAVTPAGADLVSILEQPTVGGVAQGNCVEDAAGNLACTFGALNEGLTVSLSVLYRTPVDATGSFSVTFLFTSTGNTSADQKKRSHGDDFPVVGTVAINTSPDFDGGYFTGPATVETDQELHRGSNPQSTKVPAFAGFAGGPLTVEELQDPDAFDCPGDSAASCFGQWAVINVNNDFVFEDGFEVVIGYDQIPGSALNVSFVHLVGGGSTFITEMCDADTLTNCIASIDMIMGDTYFTLILDNNGPLRGW